MNYKCLKCEYANLLYIGVNCFHCPMCGTTHHNSGNIMYIGTVPWYYKYFLELQKLVEATPENLNKSCIEAILKIVE